MQSPDQRRRSFWLTEDNAVESCFFHSVDMDLHYQTEGEGPVLICLHGGRGNSGDYFFPYLSPLADQLKMVYLDERGSGKSKPVPDKRRVDYPGMAEDIDNLISNLGVADAALLGHSWGACLSICFAINYPNRVRELYLVGGGPTYPEVAQGWWPEFYSKETARLGVDEPVQRVYDRYNRGEISADQSYREVVMCQLPSIIYNFDQRKQEILDTFARTDCTYFGPENSDFHEPDLVSRLGEVKCPTLLIAGQYDISCPVEYFGAMVRGIPDCEMRVIPRSRHYPFIDEQQLFLDAVREFREKRSTRPDWQQRDL